ncbi:MAG TPA: O-antigen ligase family protein [Pyrinomonadaceae bacterium]
MNSELPSVRRSRLLSASIFYSLLAIIVLVAVPYGSVEPWWRSAFQVAVFLLGAIAFVDFLFTRESRIARYSFLLPLLALVVFGLIQTIPFGSYYSPALSRNLPRTIGYDPHGTRVWATEMLALVLLAGMLLRSVTDEKKLKVLVYIVMGTALAAAVFGIARQTMQHQLGFGLPYLRPGIGYAQFINKNHFAFLAEMGFGLALGIIVWRGLPRERLVIIVGAILILAGAVVLANSRGGMLAVFSQMVFAGVLRLFLSPVKRHSKEEGRLNELTKSLRASRLVRAGLMMLLVVTIALGTIWIGGAPLSASLEAVPTEIGTSPDTSRWAVRRWDIWPATLKMIKDHPIAGVGFGGYWMAITRYHNASGEMVPQEAHNDYLELLASGGLIALLISACFLYLYFQSVWTRLREKPGRFVRAARCGALVGISGVAVHSVVDFGLHVPANAAVFVALIVISTSELRRDKGSATSPVRSK